MPDSRSPSRRRRVYLNSDDLLVRLVCLSEREQEAVLGAFAGAIEAAETRVIQREAVLYDARQRAPAGAPAG